MMEKEKISYAVQRFWGERGWLDETMQFTYQDTAKSVFKMFCTDPDFSGYRYRLVRHVTTTEVIEEEGEDE